MHDGLLRKSAFALAVAGGFVLAASAGAEQPRAAVWQLMEAAPSGAFKPGPTPGGDTPVVVGLRWGGQGVEGPLLVVFDGCGEDPVTPNRPILNLEAVLQRAAEPKYADWQDPGPRWRLCPAEDAVLLVRGQGAALRLALDFLAPFRGGLSPGVEADVHEIAPEDLKDLDGRSDAAAQLAQRVRQRSPAARLEVVLHYLVDGRGMFKRGEWHDVYGKPRRDEEFGAATGDYEKEAHRLPVDVLSFRRVVPIPAETEDDGGRLFKETLAGIRLTGSGLTGEKVCTAEELFLPAVQRRGDLSRSLFVAYNVSGRFSTRWTSDHSLHPGWGFRVEAWTNDFGIWMRLASGWVQSDGTWSLHIPQSAPFLGNRLRVYYRAHTSYYDVKDLDGNRYAWRDPDYTAVPTTLNVGHRFADTDGGAYRGVGELVDAAMTTWSRLYWNGGINPVPASPINVFAPNTTYDCGDGSGVPWSCASLSGNIWLIASHAMRADVVAHELGHQLNYKFWDYKLPANSGGSHTLTGCYPTRLGLTLTEGFANYIVGMVGYPGRNVAEGGFGSGRWAAIELESRNSPPTCANGWENETWVARTFWDLHDTRSDGQDVLWFNHAGAAAALYLANGIGSAGAARDMRFYENVYRNAASPGHQVHISSIFDNNRH